jgi:hypothetical protein
MLVILVVKVELTPEEAPVVLSPHIVSSILSPDLKTPAGTVKVVIVVSVAEPPDVIEATGVVKETAVGRIVKSVVGIKDAVVAVPDKLPVKDPLIDPVTENDPVIAIDPVIVG